MPDVESAKGSCRKKIHDVSIVGFLKDGSCRACSNKRGREWRRTDKGKAFDRRRSLMRLYGLTVEQRDEMLAGQHSSCLICGRHEDYLSYCLSVDHCHDSGEIRGLLCTGCNTSLGWFEKNARKILDYLEYE